MAETGVKAASVVRINQTFAEGRWNFVFCIGLMDFAMPPRTVGCARVMLCKYDDMPSAELRLKAALSAMAVGAAENKCNCNVPNPERPLWLM